MRGAAVGDAEACARRAWRPARAVRLVAAGIATLTGISAIVGVVCLQLARDMPCLAAPAGRARGCRARPPGEDVNAVMQTLAAGCLIGAAMATAGTALLVREFAEL